MSLLLDEYRHFVENPAALDAQLDCLLSLHGREKIASWKALAARGAWREFVAVLLAEHYDPAYRRSSQRNFALLTQAQRLAIGSPDIEAFDAAAHELMEERATA